MRRRNKLPSPSRSELSHPESSRAGGLRTILRAERGSGVIATAIAVPVVLFFMLFCAQLLIYLHSVSVISSLGHDAASSVARDVDAGGVADTVAAESVLRQRLGGIGDNADLFWTIDDDAAGSVRLHLRADSPSVLPSLLVRSVGLRSIDRVVSVRLERPQP